MEKKFIYIHDVETKNKLINLGYRLMKENQISNLYVFENKKTLQFDIHDKSKYILSNTLMF